jgi:hypothetical protein
MMSVGISRRVAAGAALTTLLLGGPTSAVQAQSIVVGGKEIAVHGFVQQGFNVTDENNFLTMDTTKGSAAMTDAAVNVSTNLTRKLRLGAQAYVRNIGQLGNGAVEVDWAFADYKFADAFGVRAGKMKTMLGLYSDTQDMEFLYTWALLPQGMYPLDLRSVTIAHIGADVYGAVSVGKAGSVAYTAYLGKGQDDDRGGYRYGVQDSGLGFRSGLHTSGGGLDVRWTTPVNGLMTGYSFTQTHDTVDLIYNAARLPFTAKSNPARRQSLYGDYQRSRLRLSGELRRELNDLSTVPAVFPRSRTPSRSWFGAASYRVHDMLELGTYYSNYIYNLNTAHDLQNNHIYDTAISGRVDLNRFWNVKVEGHFLDGNGNQALARGFYRRSNATGFKAKTRMLVVRTGINF